MKTDVFQVNKGTDLEAVLNEVERYGAFNGLDNAGARKLRLLCEEMLGFADHLLGKLNCTFWVENRDKAFEAHLAADTAVTFEQKDELMALASDHKNMATRGILGKIKGVFQDLIIGENELPAGGFVLEASGDVYPGFSAVWSLNDYQQAIPKDDRDKEMEGLEKSIIANVADDVLVGVTASKVEIIAKVSF